MSLHPDVLDALLNAGASAEMIVAAVKADAALDAERAENRRTKDRERQQRHRESRRVTVIPRDTPLTPLNGSPEPLPNNPPISPASPVISDEITPPSDPPTLVLEAFNLMAGEAGLPKARMTPERRKKLTTFTRRHRVEDITEAIWRIPQTPFLCGENDRGWKADFDFLLQPKSFNRILEGSYGG